MKIQLNTDHNIKGTENLAAEVESLLDSYLERFEQQITRVEVYLSDTNGPKDGINNIRCLLEARMSGLKPIAVSHEADTVMQALNAAAEKMEKILAHTRDELGRHKMRSGERISDGLPNVFPL